MKKNGTSALASGKTTRRKQARIALHLGLAALTAPVMVQANETATPVTKGTAKADSRNYSIAKQPLYSALSALAEQAGIQFVYSADMVKSLNSPGVQGQNTIEEALQKVLSGTGIGFRRTGPNTVALEYNKPVKASPDTTTLKPMTVSGKHGVKFPSYTVSHAVTATKTETPVFETPVSIQVVPRAVMDDQKSPWIKDALENVSGVRAQPTLGRGVGFIVRGFRNPRIYRNGIVANASNAGFPSDYDTSNIESIEVLKGPASVLYGRIEPGGLINVTTKKPLDTPYYSLEQQIGSYDFYRTQWDATGPVTDDKSLLYRFSGAYQDNNSFRDFVGLDRLVVNPSITWRPTASTDFTIDVEGVDQHWQADYGIPVIGRRPADIPISRSFGDPNDPIDGFHKVHVGTELNHRFNNNWAFHNRFLTSIVHSDSTFVNPAPAFGNALRADNRTLDRNIFFQENDSEGFGDNFDLTGKFQLAQTKHETLVGFDYMRSMMDYHVQGNWIKPNPALAIDIYNPGPSYGIDPALFQTTLATAANAGSNYSVFKDQWFGLYFQDHITLWDKLHITGGGRYDWARTGRGAGASFDAAEAVLPARKDEGFSPRVGVLYQPWRWLGVYGNWTTSFSANNGISATGGTFDPQIGEQFEAGVKTSLFDDRLLTTLAYYHLTKGNLLTPDLSTPNPNDSIAIGEQRSQGIEMDVTGQITDSLSLIGSYAYTDGRITKDNSGLEGKRLTNVPEHGGSLWAKYDFNGHKALDGFSVGLGGVAAGQRKGDVPNSFEMPGYVRMDAMAAYKWNIKKTRVTAQFNLKNLLDKQYYESTDPDNNVSPRLGVYPGAPLTAIGSIRVEY